MAASISAILSNYIFIIYFIYKLINLKAYSLAVSFVEEDQIIKSLGALEFGWSNFIF